MRASQAWTSGDSVVVWPVTLSTSRPLTLNATVLIAPATMPLDCRMCSAMWVTVVLPSVPVTPASISRRDGRP
jgi:hypothetical protein